jgi:uncharacterized protein (UPF0128 family)
VNTRSYEIRVVGSIGPAAREAFSGLDVDVEPPSTVLTGVLDQESLHDMLDRVHALGLELMDVRQAPSPADSPLRQEAARRAAPAGWITLLG